VEAESLYKTNTVITVNPHQEYVECGEKDNAGNLASPPSQK